MATVVFPDLPRGAATTSRGAFMELSSCFYFGSLHPNGPRTADDNTLAVRQLGSNRAARGRFRPNGCYKSTSDDAAFHLANSERLRGPKAVSHFAANSSLRWTIGVVGLTMESLESSSLL